MVHLLENAISRENAGAALFSLSLADENKIIIEVSGAIPLLVHLLENAISILLSLCKRDDENLGVISRLGVLRPLMDLANNGIEQAKRKAILLLGTFKGLNNNFNMLMANFSW
ncbi:putative armadillo-like helical protein [Helianthus annuus]|nr:putative armadillo-like helical protein [Helianthus annuus]KAJ0586463.1 putative armadillo-like helical protein [Helianthus annuus]KAJ0755881.1 putative armadillo-like helical protein [Helianthus annuus]KAJ0929354.1 putative armadillo-like helical protein [Helianthus annuus]